MRVLIFAAGLMLALHQPVLAQDKKPGAHAGTGGQHGQRHAQMRRDDVQSRVRLPDGRQLNVLKPGVSRNLKVLQVPEVDAAALVAGVYWACSEGPGGLETCDLRIVLCSDDQSICTELP